MSSIVFAWELGGGYGHIDAFLPIAKILQARGHNVVWVLKDLQHVSMLLDSQGFSYLQAPICWPTIYHSTPAMNYAGILRNTGFHDPAGLLARTKAWQTLFTYLNPDLILFDHAPTALLATNSRNYPRALFGSSFCSPPKVSPMPSIRPWLKVSDKELTGVESDVVTIANAVLSQLESKPLNILADLFEVEEDFLCALAELDHYPNRHNGRYWGPSFNDADGVDPVWPSKGNKRIFAYLSKEYAGLEPLLQQLRGASYSILVHIPGITPAFIQKFSSANLHISPYPVNLRKTAEQCDLVICHAGAGTLAAMILKGKPLLMLPMQVEQFLLARNIVSLGAGICIPAEVKKPNYLTAIHDLIALERYKNTAVIFSEKYQSTNQQQHQEKIANRCEELLNE
jgi:UDP:flavonoid glycosyltransferase YjiC (YdhE family)